MRKRTNKDRQMRLGIALIAFALVLAGWQIFHGSGAGSPQVLLGALLQPQNQPLQIPPQPAVDTRILRGKAPTLNWIVGRDCQSGVQAYLKSAATNPDAALVGTGWVDPTDGALVQGKSNNCAQGSLSMDSVVQLVHSKGGMAYLTVTMLTDGSADSWTTQQETDYVTQAANNPGLIAPIVQEVKRLNYDGVIMDLEGTKAGAPSIQQLFATYNQNVWAALKPLHKKYGIALLHKLSDHDEYYGLNGFENWQLLGNAADFIVIMALDQSYFTPGPAVSVPWLKQLLAYTLQTMPQMLPHIIWELPLYGAAWCMNNGNWTFNNGVTYQEAQTLIANLPPTQINQHTSDLNDPTSAHLTYTDTNGVTRTVWYPTERNLVNIVTEFRKVLEQTPQFKGGQLAIAVWYTAQWAPSDLWSSLNPVLAS
jgi:hypothetical protein